MPTKTRGWPAARRAAQRERIRQTKPWLRNTGPQTEAAKAKVSQNARQHGNRDATIREFLTLLAEFRRRVRAEG